MIWMEMCGQCRLYNLQEVLEVSELSNRKPVSGKAVDNIGLIRLWHHRSQMWVVNIKRQNLCEQLEAPGSEDFRLESH